MRHDTDDLSQGTVVEAKTVRFDGDRKKLLDSVTLLGYGLETLYICALRYRGARRNITACFRVAP